MLKDPAEALVMMTDASFIPDKGTSAYGMVVIDVKGNLFAVREIL